MMNSAWRSGMSDDFTDSKPIAAGTGSESSTWIQKEEKKKIVSLATQRVKITPTS